MEREVRSQRLGGWKAIARYLGRDRATAMRWETSRGLPVHRVPGGGRASVYAFGEELDEWLGRYDGGVEDQSSDLAGKKATGGLQRRTVLAGSVGLAASGLVGIGLFRRLETQSDVELLLEQARILRNQNTFETQNQAIGLAREAVRLAPQNADAWGALGYAEASASRWRPENVSKALRERAVMNGQRALDLDPGNAKGELALATALPLLEYDGWLARENGLDRAFERDPTDPDVIFERAWIYRHTGHCSLSASTCELLDPSARTAPLFNSWSRALWSSGQTEKRDETIARGIELYPTNKMLWFTNIEMTLFGGDPESAISLVRDLRRRPTLASEGEIADILDIAHTLTGSNPARFDGLLTRLIVSARTSIRAARNAVRVASIAGRPDEALKVIRAHLFAEGFAVGESVGSGLSIPMSQRHTNYLFEPPLVPLWQEKGLEDIFENVGLERFWKISRSPPDFRRK